MMCRFSISDVVGRFCRDQSGTATVEGVLWIPAYVFLMVMVADVALVFHGQANAQRLVQDANRAASVGQFVNDPDVDDNVERQTGIANFINTTLTANNIDTTQTAISVVIQNEIITTTLRIPASQLDAVGMFDVISGATVTVRTQHFLEL